MIANLQTYLKLCAEKGWLKEITEPVDPQLEIPEIHRRVVERQGPVLLFKNPIDADFPIVTNLFGTPERVMLAFGDRPKELISEVAALPEKLMPPSLKKLWDMRSLFTDLIKVGIKPNVPNAPILESGPQDPFFTRLPVTKSWPEDGGPFLTLPMVYTEDIHDGKHNFGIYRMQIYNDVEAGMHWQIHKGGGFHYHEAEKAGKSLPVAVFMGGPPALLLSAIAPLPEGAPELILASLLLGQKITQTKVTSFPLPLLGEAEFAFLGEVEPNLRRPEGPFGDHYGYYSLQHDYPVFKAKQFFHRKDAIFPATVVGEPPQEDLFLGDYLQDLLSPLFPVVMPAVRELTSYGETGFHSLAAAVVKTRYPREALSTGLRILGEGQLSLSKILMLSDTDIAFRPFDKFLEHFLARTDFETDFHVISQTSMDTLDYTGPKVNEGSKMIWMAMGDEKHDLCREIPENIPAEFKSSKVFCGGCLLVQGPGYDEDPAFAEKLAKAGCDDFRLLIVVDDLVESTENEMRFLWSVFTRFEPAADVYAKSVELKRFHPHLKCPVAIDARMKPWYPGRLIMTQEVIGLVDQKWDKLFS